MIEPVLYFGCWNDVGHFLHTRNGRSSRIAWPVADLDGGFVPGRAKGSAPEGIVRLTHLPTPSTMEPSWYTVLAFRDSSVDSRGGSHSTFVLEGKLDYDVALEAAREAFPFVFSRFEARGLELVRETP